MASQEVDMIETAHANAMVWRALWLILESRSQRVGGLIFFSIIVELQQMPIRISKLVRFAMPQIAINPALALATCFDGSRQPLQSLWAPGPKRGVGKPGLWGFGQFE